MDKLCAIRGQADKTVNCFDIMMSEWRNIDIGSIS